MAERYGNCRSDVVVVLVVVATTVQTVKEGDCSISKVCVFEQRTRVWCIHKTSVVWLCV